MLAVNVGGVVQGTELARDSFRVSGKGGVVINTASVAGLQGLPGSAVYSGKSATIPVLPARAENLGSCEFALVQHEPTIEKNGCGNIM
jgi:NADP-dependent 3-hydroxy acid dehydrogenase YdfG